MCASLELAPFKDALFTYTAFAADTSNPLDLTIDYNELRDINDRDEVPERRVKRAYYSLAVRKVEKDMVVDSAVGPLRVIATGKQKNAAFIVVYLHGQGGNRRQGTNDFTFGGNFNRLKNLAALNGGLYLSPDFSNFGAKGAGEVKAVIQSFLADSPDAKVIIACGSMGGLLCHLLANDTDLARNLFGMMFLGSFGDAAFKSSPAFKGGMPVFIGHGTHDTTSPLADMEAFARDLRLSGGQDRVMVHRFLTGSHGTPVRMSDWRLVLNWMLMR